MKEKIIRMVQKGIRHLSSINSSFPEFWEEGSIGGIVYFGIILIALSILLIITGPFVDGIVLANNDLIETSSFAVSQVRFDTVSFLVLAYRALPYFFFIAGLFSLYKAGLNDTEGDIY